MKTTTSQATRAMCANALRMLAIDAVQAANSGHPGMPMGMADIAEALWRHHLRHDPADPQWLDRDRFVVSTAGCSERSGWPGVLECSWRKRRSSAIGRSYPLRCSKAYSSIEPCPLEMTKRSRLAHFGLAGLCRRW